MFLVLFLVHDELIYQDDVSSSYKTGLPNWNFTS